MATKKLEAASSAFVLCAGTFDGARRIPAGAIVEGVPGDVLEANSHWLDPEPAAVDHAKANGAQVIQYQADEKKD